MKKFLVSILILLFLISSMGFTVNVHFCMDEFVTASIVHYDKEGDRCNNCGMEKGLNKKGCCKDVQKEIKIDDSQVLEEYAPPAIFTHILLPVEYFTFNEIVVGRSDYHFPRAKAPPDLSSVPLYIFNSIYRI